MSGVIALMLEANKNLGWRDVQGILASTSQKVNPEDHSWTINAAGYSHSYKYGFGLVDAAEAVAAAEVWQNWGTEKIIQRDSPELNIPIPDWPGKGIVEELIISESDVFEATGVQNIAVETVEVFIDLSSHSSRGDLLIKLTSPQVGPGIFLTLYY